MRNESILESSAIGRIAGFAFGIVDQTCEWAVSRGGRG